MAGMKTQMVMMVPQMVIMGWINFFFQGFVLSECFRCLNYNPPTHTMLPPAHVCSGMLCNKSADGFYPSDVRTPSSVY